MLFWGKANRATSDTADVKFSFEVPFSNLEPGEDRYVTEKFIVPADTFFVGAVPHVMGDSRIIHHAALFYSGEANLYCPGKASFIYSVGRELNVFIDSNNLGTGQRNGIFLEKGRVLELLVHANNERSIKTDGSFRLTIFGVPRAKEVTPLYLSIADYCGYSADVSQSEYVIPSGISRHEASMERSFIVPRNAKLLSVGGHLHVYGEEVSLLKNGEVIATLTPQKNFRGGIDPMDSLYTPGKTFIPPIDLRKGDVLDMKVIYEKPSDMYYSTMGIANLFLDFGHENE